MAAIAIAAAAPGWCKAESVESPAHQRGASTWWNTPIASAAFGVCPNQTESPDTTPRGRLDLELSYSFAYNDDGAGVRRLHSAPETVLRYGVFENLELRLGFPNVVNLREDGRTRTGLEDLIVGTRFKLTEQDGWIPHFGVTVEMSIPTGASDFSSERVDPAVTFLWAYDLSERVWLAGNARLAWPTEDRNRFFESTVSLALGAGVTEDVGAFIEYVGVFTASNNTGPAHSASVGLSFGVTEQLGVDVYVGLGLNQRADDAFAGVCLAYRF